MHSHDPVVIIKQALSKALVYYYPVAGRLRNGKKGKLIVDCNGEGVIFREGNANIKLSQLVAGGGLKPPFPQWDKLLVDDMWGSSFITDSPLLRMQVTRLACGGFALAHTFNHCICDAYGAYQFIKAISEFSTNPSQTTPSWLPSWGREALKPRSPPAISYPHIEYQTSPNSTNITYTETDFKTMTQTSIYLSHIDIYHHSKTKSMAKKLLPSDVIAGCLWRARTRALINPESTTRLLFPIDTRILYKPLSPQGYCGSAVVLPCVITKAVKLVEKPLCYAANLISQVKRDVTSDEYRASVLDFIDLNGRRGFCSEGAFVVSDMTHIKFTDVDFGWGQGLYGGPSRAGTVVVPGMVTSVITHKNEEGVEGVLALVSLPPEFVERFKMKVRNEVEWVSSHKHVSAL